MELQKDVNLQNFKKLSLKKLIVLKPGFAKINLSASDGEKLEGLVTFKNLFSAKVLNDPKILLSINRSLDQLNDIKGEKFVELKEPKDNLLTFWIQDLRQGFKIDADKIKNYFNIQNR